MQRPSLILPPPVKFSMTVGAGLDIPTGEYLKGTHDQMVLLGGLSSITGIVGPGNSFKTTIMRFITLCAIARLYYVAGDTMYYSSYDTEINVYENRNYKLSQNFPTLMGKNILEDGLWQITDKTIYSGNTYWAEVKNYLKEKRNDKKKPMYSTSFLDRDGKSAMKTMAPTFNDFDSLTHFITENVEAMMDKTEIGEKEGNTIFMQQGRAKAQMLMEMPTVAGANFNFFLFTAHIGKAITMPTGPGAPPPRKQLEHMPQDEVIKGVTANFFYLLHNCWYINSAKAFLNKDTKAPFYPYEPGDEVEGDLDLNIVTMKQLRGKNGGSGFKILLLVSQREGVLPYMSEFHYVKVNDYGLEGNDRTYQLALCPEDNLTRTTVRKKLRESRKLQRAVEITSELLQIEIFHPRMKADILKPAELRAKLIEKGYDLEWILENTRSWHGLNDEEAPGYSFSTPDLCRAAMTDYRPYWLEADLKTVKPEYAKLKADFMAQKQLENQNAG